MSRDARKPVFGVSAKLMCAFVFALAKIWFSHDAAHIVCIHLSHCISENAKCLILNKIVFQNAKNSVLDLLKSMSIKSKTFNLCLMIIVLANLNTFLGNTENCF